MLALAATAALGLVLEMATEGAFINGFLEFDWTHDIVHVVLAAIALYVGFAASGAYAKTYAKVFGPIYLALGITGFFLADLKILHLELGENLVHLVIGAWGALVGYTRTTPSVGQQTATMPAGRA